MHPDRYEKEVATSFRSTTEITPCFKMGIAKVYSRDGAGQLSSTFVSGKVGEADNAVCLSRILCAIENKFDNLHYDIGFSKGAVRQYINRSAPLRLSISQSSLLIALIAANRSNSRLVSVFTMTSPARRNDQKEGTTVGNVADGAELSHDGHISDGSDFFPRDTDLWDPFGHSKEKESTEDGKLKSQEEACAQEQEKGAGDSKPSTSSKSRAFGRLGNLTLAAIGDHKTPLPSLPIVASKPRKQWIAHLDESGYEGLLFADTVSLQDQPGFELSWWFDNKDDVRRRLILTPLENSAAAGILTLRKSLPSDSLLNAVICTVAELVASGKDSKYASSTPQLFMPSQGGFSQDFRFDEYDTGTGVTRYRCFWYFGPEDMSESTPGGIGRDCVFIGSAGDNRKVFGADTVLTLAAYYGEADRKFRLHAGDILVIDNRFPFSVDLPIGGRAKGARILSWQLFPMADGCTLPKIMPESEIVLNIEDVVATNTEACDFYTSEFESFEVNPGAIGDPEGFMQRLRVTPRKIYSERGG